MPTRRWPRLVLLAGVLSGLTTLVGLPTRHPEQVGIATDVYALAGRALLDGGDLYATVPAHPGFAFRYPPVLALAVVPHGVLGQTGAFVLQTALNLAALAALAGLLVRLAERAGATLDRRDRLLVGAYAVLGGPVAANLVMGQVNPLLALGVAAGTWFVLREREQAGGVAFGLAALVKLFPALLGAWLVRLRAWRAVAAATATGLSLLLVGVLALGPGVHESYVGTVLADEAAVAAFADGPDPAAPYVTVRRQVALVAPGLSGTAKSAVGAAVLAPVVVAASRVVEDTVSRLLSLQATLLATLLLVPLEPFYLVLGLCPLVPLLYALERGRARRLFLAGAVLLSVPVTYESVVAVTAVAPAGLADAVRGIARAAFGVALPPSVGAWLVLAACVLAQRARSNPNPPEPV